MVVYESQESEVQLIREVGRGTACLCYADELRTSEPGQLPALSSSRMEAEKNCKSRARVGQSVSADGGR